MLRFIPKSEGSFGNPNISDSKKHIITGWKIINEEDQNLGTIEKGLVGLNLRSNEDLSMDDIIQILRFMKKQVEE